MRHVRKELMLVLVTGLLFGFLTPPSYSQNKSGSPEEQWEFTMIPYAWLAGVSGDFAVGDRTVHVSTPFSDIIDNLDFAGMAQFETKKGRWGLFLQPNYVKVSPTASLSRPAATDIVTGGPAVREVDVRLASESWIVEFGGFYRLGEWHLCPDKSLPATFDVLAGGRYWYLQNRISLSLPERGVSFRQTRYGDIIDPIVGFRSQIYLIPKLFVNIRGDVGGFGVSSNSSHVSWNGVGVLGYDMNPCSTILAGYRYLYINYSPSGGLGIRATMQGPVLGFGYRF